MSTEVDDSLQLGVNIVHDQLSQLLDISKKSMLNQAQAECLVEYIRALSVMKNFRRQQPAETRDLTTEEYENTILEEAKRLKAKYGRNHP
jgi:hypothetical protein